MNTRKKKIMFIINPISGIGKQRIVEKEIEIWLDYDKFESHVVYTQYAHHATEISKQAVEENFDIVVAVGGDGSINDIVKSIVDTPVALGIIPVGSGNGLARHLNIALNVKKAILILNKCNISKIDTISVNNQIYASIAGIGFDALVAQEMVQAKIRGIQGYSKILLKYYPLYKPQKFELDIDGVKMEREALLISFANSNQFGYNTTIAPTAELNDGLMDVCVVQKVPIPLVPITIPLLYTKNFEKSAFVEIFKAKKATVFNNELKIANLDGECVELDSHLEFVIKPQSLNIIF